MSDCYISNLLFKRFRCFQHATFRPINGVNILTGADDVGKSTVLYGTALLLSHDPTIVLKDTDYHGLNVEDEFEIWATITCVGSEPNSTKEFTIGVHGTKDYKLVFEIDDVKGLLYSEADAIWDTLSRTRVIGSGLTSLEKPVVLGTNSISPEDSEQEQVHLAIPNLLNSAVSTPVSSQLVPIGVLQKALTDKARPKLLVESAIDVVDIPAVAESNLIEPSTGASIPLPLWGDGTQASVYETFASQSSAPGSIRLIKNFANNLDSTAQQVNLDYLTKLGGQTFAEVTNPEILKSTSDFATIVIAPNNKMGKVEGDRIDDLIVNQPSPFFTKKVIFCEGSTEVGFNTGIFSSALGAYPKQFGMFICDGRGYNSTLTLAKQWCDDGLVAGVFVDKEVRIAQKTLIKLKKRLGSLFYEWEKGCIESNIIWSVPPEHLIQFLSHPEVGYRHRLRTIAVRLGLPTDSSKKLELEDIMDFIRDFDEFQGLETVQKKTAVEKKFYQTMYEAALGIVPLGTPEKFIGDFKGHKSHWFKSFAGGMELASKLISCGVWNGKTKERLLCYINAHLEDLGLPPIDDLPH